MSLKSEFELYPKDLQSSLHLFREDRSQTISMGALRADEGTGQEANASGFDLRSGFFANAFSQGIVDPADYVNIPYARQPALLARLKSHILGISYSCIEDSYVMGPELGEGLAGIIRYCVDRRTGESLACKTLPKSRMVSVADIASVRTEICALRKLSDHPAVAGMRYLAEDDENVHIVMELGEGGDLFDRIQQRGRFSEENAAKVVRSLFSVVHYGHSYGIVHRDIKPENILLTSPHSDTAIKVIDFGQSVFIQRGTKLTHPIGTPYYIAPEVLDCSYGRECDMWSVGVVLYVLLCGVPPFWEDSQEQTFEKIRKADLDVSNGPWREISSEAKDLVRRLLCRDPSKRISAQEAKVHPWILQHCGDVTPIVSPRVAPFDDSESLRPDSKRPKCRSSTRTPSDSSSYLGNPASCLSNSSMYLSTIPLPMEISLASIPQARVLSISETLNLFGDPRNSAILGRDAKRTCAVEMKNVQGSSDHSHYKIDQMGLNAINVSLLSAMTVHP